MSETTLTAPPAAPAAPATPAPEAPTAAPADWKASLPEDLRADPVFASLPDVPTLAKSYKHAQTLIGVDKIPSDMSKWTPEIKAKFGIPEAPDKYTNSDGIKYAEGIQVDKLGLEEVKKLMHETGITKTQAQKLLDWHATTLNKEVASQKQAQEATSAAATQSLKAEWGLEYDQNIRIAQTVVRQFGDEKAVEELNASGLGNNPALIKMLLKVGQSITDDTALGQAQTVFKGAQGSAQAEYTRLMADPGFRDALMRRDHPNHAGAVAQREALMNQGAY